MIWLAAWASGHWKGLAAVALAATLWAGLAWYGHSQRQAGATAVRSAWSAAVAKAEQDARRDETALRARVDAANTERTNAQAEIQRLSGDLSVAAGQLRDAARAPRDVPAGAGAASCARDIAAERQRAAALGGVVGEMADAGAVIARERDEFAADAVALRQAWPR